MNNRALSLVHEGHRGVSHVSSFSTACCLMILLLAASPPSFGFGSICPTLELEHGFL